MLDNNRAPEIERGLYRYLGEPSVRPQLPQSYAWLTELMELAKRVGPERSMRLLEAATSETEDPPHPLGCSR